MAVGIGMFTTCGQAQAQADNDKQNSEQLLIQADAAYDKGKFDLALEEVNKAISLDPQSYVAYVTRSNIYFNTKRYGLAEADNTKAIKLTSNDSPKLRLALYNKRGTDYLLSYKLDQARDDFSKSIEIDPSLFVSYGFRGIAYETMGNFDKAEQDFDKSNSLAPETLKWAALAPLANLYFLKADFKNRSTLMIRPSQAKLIIQIPCSAVGAPN